LRWPHRQTHLLGPKYFDSTWSKYPLQIIPKDIMNPLYMYIPPRSAYPSNMI
jgi:hypothetical protein